MTHRMKVKIGAAEFEAEGAEQTVQAQYDQFLAAIKASPNAGTATIAKDLGPNDGEDIPFNRIFELRQDGVVTLKVLPRGDNKETDAFLLLLLGYRRLKQEENVLATHLLRAAQHSGIPSYRPAHALADQDRYVIRGGFKKGSTYSLNNQGITKAEEIAAAIFK